MSAGRATTAPSFDNLRAAGYRVRELWLDNYFDGISATKQIGGVKVEVYVGSDDGHDYFTPQVYVNDDMRIGEATTPEKAARIAEFRALMMNAAIAKATGQVPT